MQQNRVNPIIQWWMTPKLPHHDIYDLPLLINKSKQAKYQHLFSQWLVHPIKRRLARLYLKFLQLTTDIKVIGITGSAGKTTTKEMLYSILKQNSRAVCTRTFIDPVYNIPNTILSTPVGAKYLILEMGVEYQGEMDFYLWLAKPDIGVITNIFPTHLEYFGDVKGVLNEKQKLVMALSKDGTAVLNSGDKLLSTLKTKLKSKVVWFPFSEDQNLLNADAATKVAENLGIPKNEIIKGLKEYQSPVHRLSLHKLKNGAYLLDDSYNSNPGALSATLKYFNKISGKNNKIAVLGDMKELGKFERKFHSELGKEVSRLNFSAVIGVGAAVKYLLNEVKNGAKVYSVQNQKDVMPILKEYLIKDNFILIKGSRSIELDKVVDALI